MRILAQFIGEDGSMGYKENGIYVGEILANTWVPTSREGGICPYTVEGFLRNWRILEAEVDLTDSREIVP